MRRSITLSLAVVSLATAGSAGAEVVPIGDHGFVSRNVATVAVDPARAWRALVAPAGWWNGAHTHSGDAANLSLDPRAGGCFCETLPAKGQTPAGGVEHMRVVHAAPARLLRLSGALGPLQSEPVAGVLTVTLEPVPGGTRIVWEYAVGGAMRFAPGAIGPAVDAVMAEQLTRLAARLGPLRVIPQSRAQ